MIRTWSGCNRSYRCVGVDEIEREREKYPFDLIVEDLVNEPVECLKNRVEFDF